MFEIKNQRLRQYSQTSVKVVNFVQTNHKSSSKNCILSKQTAPFEAVKRGYPNKLNPR